LAIYRSKAEPDTHRSCGTREKVRAEGEGEMRPIFRVRDATQTDLKREFERHGHTDWQWVMAALLAFSMLDYLCMGLKAMK
jgi:hypothetical protein